MEERLLIVEDEDTLRESLKRVFQREGYQVEAVMSAEVALEHFEEASFDLIITDIILPGITGIELLKRVKEISPEQIVIIVTAYASLETAVETLRAGAFDYIVKPIIHEEIKQIVKNALRQRILQKENTLLKKQLGEPYDLSRIIGESPEIQKIVGRIRKIADARSPVLLQGELGTGKKLIARAIHFSSHRAERAFISVNLRSLPQGQIEAELFGVPPGKGLGQGKEGIFQQAAGGTIYLDGIEELSPDLQLKLLKTVEDQEVKVPSGTPAPSSLDLLFMAGTTKDLEALVKAGKFREEIYNRFRVITIKIPPLRERPEDLEGLIQLFIQKYTRKFGKKVQTLEPEVGRLFARYAWPGNGRELRNVIERAVMIAPGEAIQMRHIPNLESED
ncbi:MAG TPA: sigma-54 dependent transcriptional regulator [Thermodesulfobacteriota bacterium]|nr:sigma-54 dependent transcriptional regulator [Thermodesulfobacteriota bacterium]